MTRRAVIRDYGGVSADHRRADRRSRLVAAARTIWGREGIGAVTVRGVCRAAGLTNRYFYEHFANRDEVLVEVADQVREEMFHALVETSDAVGGEIEQRLQAALMGLLDRFGEDPEMLAILTTNVAGVEGLADRQRETLDLLAELVLQHGSQIPGSELRIDAKSRRDARFIVGGLHQLIIAWVDEQDISAAELAATCTRLGMAIVHLPQARARS